MKKLILLLTLTCTLSASAFDWQGHRGARGLYPENTVGAMREALSYPIVTTLELDVVISKDGEVVVSHEPWMSEEICLDASGNPVKEKAVNLFQLTAAEIAEYDCGTKPHPRFPQQKKIKAHKPVLKDLLADINKTHPNIPFNIEIKSLPADEKAGFQPDVKTFTDKVIATIKSQIDLSRVHIQSFDWRVLKYLKSKYPLVKTVALTEDEKFSPKTVLSALGFIPTVFSPYYKNLTKPLVSEFQRNGMKVIPWTVNEPAEMRLMINMGVDGIITDYPNKIFPAAR